MFKLSRALSAPLKRTKDPLLSSSVAQHFILPSGNQFIIRPPPSVVPPTVPISQSSTDTTTTSNPFLESIVASPLKTPSSSSSTSPSIDPSLLPPSRSRRPTPTTTSTRLTPEQVTQLHQLRTTSSSTRSQLAKQFGIPPQVVGRLGYGSGSEARLVERVKRGEIELEREEREAGWGWKKSIAREERRRRRSMW
ncbi:hypothetical protein JCM3765_007249 [Sporobolomyces pararoseus]